jgi:hypothetical protein
LVVVCSSKGAPGVTSTSLALAAVWPRPVVLVEADPSGGDVAYRCQHADGGPMPPAPGMVQLATAVRRGLEDANAAAIAGAAQPLACGVRVVQGVAGPAQAAGMRELWPSIAQAAADVSQGVDTIVDIGRLALVTRPLVEAADAVLLVAQPTMSSVMHTRTAAAAMPPRAGQVVPVVVGPHRHAAGNCQDVDRLLETAMVPAAAAQPIAEDAKALERLESGRRSGFADSRLGQSALALARALVGQDDLKNGVMSA